MNQAVPVICLRTRHMAAPETTSSACRRTEVAVGGRDSCRAPARLSVSITSSAVRLLRSCSVFRRSGTAGLPAVLAGLALLAGCDIGAMMSNQASIQAYEEQADPPPPGAVPIGGGEGALRDSAEGSLRNPVASTPESVKRGDKVIQAACSHCHGKDLDGEGTVGQSFHPLPADLRSDRVLGLSDDRIFRVISYGSGRCPPLHSTLTVEDRWHAINALRSRPPRAK